MIGVINYGCGNVQAILNIYKSYNIPSKVINSKYDLDSISHLILPGVGSFDFVMNSFNKSGLRTHIENLVINKNMPVLGICAGMQILSNSSEEGKIDGLGWIPGKVIHFNESKLKFHTKCPHLGWNKVHNSKNILFNSIKPNSYFYFVHSYHYILSDNSNLIGYTLYGYSFASAINNNNIYGVQFHPEKSHENGMQLLINFSNF